jgi:para-aminobenzoate synthetase/4-amino-4-deoxychorismate lyase
VAAAYELHETMRWTPDEAGYLLDRHLARLEQSARFFGFPYPSDHIRTALDASVRSASGPRRIRLLLGPDGSVRLEQTPLELAQQRFVLRLAVLPIDPSDVFLFHKTTNRGVYERARRPDCDDVILWNPAREVTETTIANLVVEVDGVRVTPPVACGLLPGTLRAELLATNQVTEARVTIEQLRRARRIWAVNSVRGWCPATLIDDAGGEQRAGDGAA